MVRSTHTSAYAALVAALIGVSSCESSTSPTADAPVLVGAGDIARCPPTGAQITAALLDRIDGSVFTTGDHAYENGTTIEYAQCYHPSWGRHKARTRPSPGNHDYHSGGAAPYFAYFGDAAGPAGRGYYSFDIGTWHVISLNSNVPAGPGSAQIAWLRADLAAHRTGCAVAYWHHPVFSSGQHGNDRTMAEIWRVLDSAGVDLVIAGHDHDYERFAPQDYLGNARPDGVRQFVVGTGGGQLRAFASVQPNSEVRNSTTFGVLKLSLQPTAYTWQFVPQPGATFVDTGSADCID